MQPAAHALEVVCRGGKENRRHERIKNLANLIVNVVFLRNTMSKEIVHLCAQNQVPWLRVSDGRLSAASKRAIDSLFLQLGGKLFFTHVEPMKSRSKMPRRGYGEFVSEMVSFAGQAENLADMWRGANAIEALAAGVRRISGFGGK